MTILERTGGRPVAGVPAGQARREQQRQSTRLVKAQERARTRRRRVPVAVVAVAVLLGAAAAATALRPAGSTGPPGPRTLLRAAAVSAVGEGLGSGWFTDDRTDTLQRFDPRTGHLLGSAVSVQGRPVALSVAFGRVWVANALSNTVEEIARTPAGRWRVAAVAPVPAGPTGLVAAGGRVWVTSVLAGDLSAVDPRTGQVTTRVHLAAGAVRVAAGDGALWVTGSSDALTEVQVTGHGLHLRSVHVGQGPLGVAFGDGAVWVADGLSSSVARVDPSDLRVTATYPTAPDPLAVAVRGRKVWVASGAAPELRPLHGDVVPLPGVARQLVTAGGTLWVATGGPGAVVTVRTA